MKWALETDTVKSERKAAQVVFEEDVLMYSRSKYWDDYQRAPDEGLPEQELLDSSVLELADVFQEWIDITMQEPKTPRWVHPLLEVGAQKMADITIRSLIKCWFSSQFWGHGLGEEVHTPPLAQTVATMIATSVSDIIAYQRAKTNNRTDWMQQSKFIKNWTPKRCRAFSKKVTENISLTVKQKHDFGHNMLRIAASSNIINMEFRPVKRGRTLKRYTFVEFHQSVLETLHNKHELLQTSSLIYRPMIAPPTLHKIGASGGYIHERMRKPMVQKYKSNFWGDEVKEQKYSEPSDTVLNGLNGMMLTEWKVNTRVHEVMSTLFKNNTALGNIPYYSFEEFMYNEPYPKDGDKVDKAIWCQLRQEAWSEWYKQEQARGRMLIRLELAKDLSAWGYFYHVFTLDFRGRAYTNCELLSPQSSDLDRALIEFANEVKLTERGKWWQKVHVANVFDQDKQSLDARVKWTEDNMDMIRAINEDPYDNKDWIDASKKKNKSFQRLAAVFDICREDGMSSLPIQLDGQCNGSQHWAAIMGDTDVGEKVGLVPYEEPQDLYQHIADGVTNYCLHHKNDNKWCWSFLEYWKDSIDRKVTKRSTMCDAYGLTFYGIQKYLQIEGHLDWVDKSEKNAAITELARAIRSALDRCLSEPNKGKEYLKQIVTVANDLNRHIEYTTPSGFKVVHNYTLTNSRRSVSKLFGNKELSFFVPTKDVNKRGALQAIAPNFIHSLDAAHMFLTIDKMLSKGIYSLSMIHDSFGCHANYVDDMRDILREEFLNIHKVNQLEVFRQCVQNQLGVMLPAPPDTGDLDLRGVLSSNYFFS